MLNIIRTSVGNRMDIEKIRTLIELMEEKDLVNLEIKTGEDSVSLTRHYNTPMPSMMAVGPR